MLHEAPLLEIRRSVPRASPDQLRRLQGIPTGWLIDAMDGRGALDHRIKPLDQKQASFLGPVLPCVCGPADNLGLAAAIAQAQKGDVLVAATDFFTATAVIGDLMLGLAKNRGVAAIVTDGLARDIVGCEKVGLPLYCAGVTPNSPHRSGPGSVGISTIVGGVLVEPGDVIAGDRDGAVIVPRARIDEVIARLDEIRKAEAAAEARVASGADVPGYVAALLDSGRVRYID